MIGPIEGTTRVKLQASIEESIAAGLLLINEYLSMYPGIELRTMRYIVAVATELHFSRAAERVHVAQPSLSKQIRNVEEELGVELFNRNRRKVEITDAGRAFIENAQQALLYADRAAGAARVASAGGRGKLLLGVSPSIDLELFFRVGKAFEKRYADVQFQFVSAFASQQAEWVMRSDLHAGLIELPIRYRGLAVLIVFREPVLLAISRNDRFAWTKEIAPEQLKDRRLILLADAADRAHDKILGGIQTWGFRPEKILNVMSLAQALDFVAAGEGIAVLRASSERFESKNVILRSVPGLPSLDIGIVYRRNIRTPLVRNLLRVAREVFSEERTRIMRSR